MENARHGLAFASGLAAEDAILRTLDPGDHLIPTDAYGGTFRLVAAVHERHGIAWTAVDLHDRGAIDAAWRDETRLVWVESPTNPALSIVDIEAVAKFARARGARVVVDNTFATPYLQQPLALGADVVVHSSTKYLGGHSDDSRRSTTSNSPTSSGSCRTRWVPSLRRSTATSCCAA